ncbi:hypothetical protein [Pelagibius sp. Alg239-R121]|uniref:hypothetical protein n=1 Tax=Pelagibius sp. Alg239-R121 TaxID=2993448 RepID=UPI0024A69566|nr:hypothetical protein [Pelagibius sp. Alg239-R121]
MKRLFVPLLALPLAACSVGTDIESFKVPSLGTLFDSARPETQSLTASISPVQKPTAAELRSMTVTSLENGERMSFSVRSFGNGIRVTEDSGCVWTRAGDWFSPSDSWSNCGVSNNWHTGQAKVRELDSLYPLKVGSVGRYERSAVSHTGRSYTRETRCEVTDAVEVVRPGQIATPAFVVECNDKSRRRTTWYAPGKGPVAYHEVHRRNGVEEAWVRTN